MECFPLENRRGPPFTNRINRPVETGIYEVNQRLSVTSINICTVCDQQYVGTANIVALSVESDTNHDR